MARQREGAGGAAAAVAVMRGCGMSRIAYVVGLAAGVLLWPYWFIRALVRER